MRRWLPLVLCLYLASAAPAAAARPHVLVIRFGPDLAVNPVTKDWVTHQIGRAHV